MRIDKYLKISRLIKRRAVAKEACENSMVLLNGKIAKPSDEINIGDIIEINYPNRSVKVEVLKITESTKKSDSLDLYKSL